jgi:hypothetical protein
MVDETTFGTSPTVTRFLEFNNETVQQTIARIDSSGLRVGRRVERSTQWVVGRKDIAGDIEFEVQQQGMGLLFKHAMGAVASSQPNVGSAPTAWEHTFTVGALDGKSFTHQIGVASADGTQRAFTYAGCKIPKWDLSCAVDGLLLFKPTINGISETSATAMAAASYAASSFPLMFSGATITLPGGAVGNISKFDLSADNGLKTDRYFMSSSAAFTKKEQLEDQLRAYTGSIDVEFDDLTAYNLFVNGTLGSMTAFFVGTNIASIYNYALEVTMPAVRFDGTSPDVSGPGIVTMSMPFVCLDDGAGTGGLQLKYRTTDSTP